MLPAGHTEAVTNVMDSGKVFRLGVRGAAVASQEWLTVFDAAPSAGEASTALPVTVTAGPVSGVVRRRGAGNQAVLLSQREADQPVTEEVAYRVPAADTQHVIAGSQPGAQYAVTAAPAEGQVEVHVNSGGGIATSGNGVLRFRTGSAGNVG